MSAWDSVRARIEAAAAGGRWAVRMEDGGAALVLCWRFPTREAAAEAARVLKTERRDFFLGFTLSAHDTGRRDAAR